MTMTTAMLIEEQNYSDEAPMDTCIEKFFFTKVFQAFQAKLINFWIGHISRDFVTQTQKLELSELLCLLVFALFTSSSLCKLSHFANVSSELEWEAWASFHLLSNCGFLPKCLWGSQIFQIIVAQVLVKLTSSCHGSWQAQSQGRAQPAWASPRDPCCPWQSPPPAWTGSAPEIHRLWKLPPNYSF